MLAKNIAAEGIALLDVWYVQSTDYTVLNLINGLYRFQYSDGVKLHIWCDENFVPTDVLYELDFSGEVFTIKGHALIG